MTIRTKTLAAILALLVAFASGRYSVNQIASSTTLKTAESDTKSQKDKDVHTITTTTTTKDPSGKQVTTTTTDTTAETRSTKDQVTKSVDQTSVVMQKQSKLNLSVLGGIDIRSRTPVYGASITKQFLGPITLGVFGLTNGTVGASIGIDF